MWPIGELVVGGRARRAVTAVSQDMPEITAHVHLAGAYLAIADDPEPPAAQRSVSRALCGLFAIVVLALGAPLAWTSAAAGKSLDVPAAATVKGTGSDEDDEDGEPWPATDA